MTLDLSSLVSAGATDPDSDVGYFDVDGQFVERSPVKADWSGGLDGLGGSAGSGGCSGGRDRGRE